MIKFFRKYHKWLGVIYAIIILSYVFSGIVLNHRDLLSGIDVNRKLLPEVYSYRNWNNAAVKSSLKFSPDSILLYGNIGVWLTDSTFSGFGDFYVLIVPLTGLIVLFILISGFIVWLKIRKTTQA